VPERKQDDQQDCEERHDTAAHYRHRPVSTITLDHHPAFCTHRTQVVTTPGPQPGGKEGLSHVILKIIAELK